VMASRVRDMTPANPAKLMLTQMLTQTPPKTSIDGSRRRS
jgi:hypothetical protein